MRSHFIQIVLLCLRHRFGVKPSILYNFHIPWLGSSVVLFFEFICNVFGDFFDSGLAQAVLYTTELSMRTLQNSGFRGLHCGLHYLRWQRVCVWWITELNLAIGKAQGLVIRTVSSRPSPSESLSQCEMTALFPLEYRCNVSKVELSLKSPT